MRGGVGGEGPGNRNRERVGAREFLTVGMAPVVGHDGRATGEGRVPLGRGQRRGERVGAGSGGGERRGEQVAAGSQKWKKKK